MFEAVVKKAFSRDMYSVEQDMVRRASLAEAANELSDIELVSNSFVRVTNYCNRSKSLVRLRFQCVEFNYKW